GGFRNRAGSGFVGTRAETAMKHTPLSANSGATAAIGDVRLTIRSSRSALSDNPLGPSASIGIAWGRTHDQGASVMTTGNRPATDGSIRRTRCRVHVVRPLWLVVALSSSRA